MPVDSVAQSLLSTEERSRALRIVNRHVRIASFNVRACPDGDEGLWKLSGLTAELHRLRIGLAGLQELRRPGSGQADVPAATNGPSWSLLWSGHTQQRQHGVGLLMTPEWDNSLISWEPIRERLLVARFAGNRKQTITVIVAYSPTDCDKTQAQADAFYDSLATLCVKASDRKDVVFVLGDFNAAVGKDTTADCIGPHQPHTAKANASPNGLLLLTVAAVANLRIANTFFSHKARHQYTHTSARASAITRTRKSRVSRLRSVKDYILISSQHRHSVTDCKAYPCISWT